MFETVFMIFMAGCSHDLSACGPLQTVEVTAANLEHCEVMLDEHLLDGSAEWPVATGSCHAKNLAEVPGWYPETTLAAAGEEPFS